LKPARRAGVKNAIKARIPPKKVFFQKLGFLNDQNREN